MFTLQHLEFMLRLKNSPTVIKFKDLSATRKSLVLDLKTAEYVDVLESGMVVIGIAGDTVLEETLKAFNAENY